MIYMKKMITLLFVATLFISCSNDDSDTPNLRENVSINPPSWIQGTWVNEEYLEFGFRFTTNDVFIITDGSEISYVNVFRMDASSAFTDLYDTTSNTKYSIFEKTAASDLLMFQFTKVSNTEIGMSQYGSDSITLKKQ